MLCTSSELYSELGEKQKHQIKHTFGTQKLLEIIPQSVYIATINCFLPFNSIKLVCWPQAMCWIIVIRCDDRWVAGFSETNNKQTAGTNRHCDCVKLSYEGNLAMILQAIFELIDFEIVCCANWWSINKTKDGSNSMFVASSTNYCITFSALPTNLVLLKLYSQSHNV